LPKTTQSARIDVTKVTPEAYQAMAGLGRYVRQSGLEPKLLDLIRTRSSQINGCAYCIDMHSKDARAAGETEQRLYSLDAWRETPFYTDRERATLAWTEAVTLVSQGHVPDEVYEVARKHFSEKESLTSRWRWQKSIAGTGSRSACARCPESTSRPPTRRRPPLRARIELARVPLGENRTH
jgi:AhpD family alkylhydroperoxidase